MSSGLPHVTNHFQRSSDTRHKHTHTRQLHCRGCNTLQRCTATIIGFLCLGVCSDNMWSSHFIPHVKRYYSCCFPLIDSFFFHFISSECVQGRISRLRSHLLETLCKNSNEDEYAHKWLCLMCVSFYELTNEILKCAVKTKKQRLSVCQQLLVGIRKNMRIALIIEEWGRLFNNRSIVFTAWWYS